MNEYYGYPENDWRNYLMHKASGGTSRSGKHKYLFKYVNKNGNTVYVYGRAAKGGKRNAAKSFKEGIEDYADLGIARRNEKRRAFMDKVYMRDPDYRKSKERLGIK